MNSLDLSNNLLSGRIPPELGQLNLDVFNLSNNDLAGRIPDDLDIAVRKDSFLGNPKLYGGQNLMLPACYNPHKLSPQTLATILVDELYILHNLREANVIGYGVAGKVYKVILHNGQAVAVKKIGKTSRSMGSFKRKGEQEENKIGEVEVHTLGLIRHNNILKLLCCISSEESEFKLSVYEFMPNGSLFDCLHGGPERGKPLQWPIRYQIALDAARGLSYLHHDCSPPI
ncbi:hypothetical protein SUGI_1032970 [Cryptomeria japonica]|nr:hypothetical protein SUGI_1032970 [Cryptomeria japonica]